MQILSRYDHDLSPQNVERYIFYFAFFEGRNEKLMKKNDKSSSITKKSKITLTTIFRKKKKKKKKKKTPKLLASNEKRGIHVVINFFLSFLHFLPREGFGLTVIELSK
jgi:hypothetical protein